MCWFIGLIAFFSLPTEKVHVKCNQSGKKYKVGIIALSREDGEHLTELDLKEGSELLMDYKKRSYPVKVISTDLDGKQYNAD